MSAIPKAKRSEIKDLVVHPEGWDSYPSVEYSTLTSCSFTNLTANTKIDRCTLKDVSIESRPKGSGGSGRSNLDRSDIADCEIIDSNVDRSQLKQSRVCDCRVERSQLKGASLVGPKVQVERSELDDCEITGKSTVERSTVRNSLLEEAKAVRSNVTGSYVTMSSLEKATLNDCDVSECKIQGTTFTGMILRNGKWENGDLLERIDPKKEVTIIHKSKLLAEQAEPRQTQATQMQGLQTQGIQTQQATGVIRGSENPPPPSYQVGIMQNPLPLRDYKEPVSGSGTESPFEPDAYDGPRVGTPPPYDQSAGGSYQGDVKF